MLEINATFGQECQNLGLVGRTGENASRRIVFDCEAVLGEFPEAGIVCALRRACDAEAYAKELTAEGKKRLLTLSAADVAAPGSLMIELRAVEADAIRKSAVYVGRIERGLSGQGDAPGNPVADVIDRMNAQAEAARKAADAAQQMADDVRRKLEAGELNGSDAEVTAENIQSALGYAPVKDVRLNGESLVQDSAATIPLAGYNRLGAVQLDPAGFAAASVEGKLALVPPTDAQISTHTHTQRPITPSCMDYAVKAAMCDGKGAAWNRNEKNAAQRRAGINELYELIEEFDLIEASTFERTEEPDGTPFAFIDIITQIIAPTNTSLKSGAFFAQAKNIRGNFVTVGRGYMAVRSSGDSRMGYMQRTRIRHGYWESYWCDWEKNVGVLSFKSADVYNYWIKYKESDYKAINKIYETVVLPAGTHIRIFGVRA